ncbi:hypothetical protein FHL15_010930 [Xylaria flabelliformis]|uniref:Uncharacterized protein n=1 Tax=Xylaria flabelliformis TaxID=2512241 RepID=A0A553HJP6_9PEZI|nr:hypothetical protein FHL15_010930 [Xylaria flabelliformis]
MTGSQLVHLAMGERTGPRVFYILWSSDVVDVKRGERKRKCRIPVIWKNYRLFRKVTDAIFTSEGVSPYKSTSPIFLHHTTAHHTPPRYGAGAPDCRLNRPETEAPPSPRSDTYKLQDLLTPDDASEPGFPLMSELQKDESRLARWSPGP